jgi:hypothetical protein
MTKEVRNIRRQKLPNGLTVITEQMQHIRSAHGIWPQTGFVTKIPNGTASPISLSTWSSKAPSTAPPRIARQVDSIGGNMTPSLPRNIASRQACSTSMSDRARYSERLWFSKPDLRCR